MYSTYAVSAPLAMYFGCCIVSWCDWTATWCSQFCAQLDGCSYMEVCGQYLFSFCILSLTIPPWYRDKSIHIGLASLFMFRWIEHLKKSLPICCGSPLDGCVCWWQRCHRSFPSWIWSVAFYCQMFQFLRNPRNWWPHWCSFCLLIYSVIESAARS